MSWSSVFVFLFEFVARLEMRVDRGFEGRLNDPMALVPSRCGVDGGVVHSEHFTFTRRGSTYKGPLWSIRHIPGPVPSPSSHQRRARSSLPAQLSLHGTSCSYQRWTYVLSALNMHCPPASAFSSLANPGMRGAPPCASSVKAPTPLMHQRHSAGAAIATHPSLPYLDLSCSSAALAFGTVASSMR